MIGGADDERIAGQAIAIHRIQNLADGEIQISRTGVEAAVSRRVSGVSGIGAGGSV